MRGALWSILILSLSFGLYGQNIDMRFGFTGSTPFLMYTHVPLESYKAPNSYFTYHESSSGSGVINAYKTFNGYSLGGLATITFRKLTFNMAPSFMMQKTTFIFEKEYYSERVVGFHGFRLPTYWTFRLFRKVNSLYISFGRIWNVTKDFDFQHPGRPFLFAGGQIYNGGVDYGDYHFDEILYDEQNFVQRFIGFGKSIKDVNVGIRFIQRKRKHQEYILATTWQFELNLSYHFLNASDFTKKRKVYSE